MFQLRCSIAEIWRNPKHLVKMLIWTLLLKSKSGKSSTQSPSWQYRVNIRSPSCNPIYTSGSMNTLCVDLCKECRMVFSAGVWDYLVHSSTLGGTLEVVWGCLKDFDMKMMNVQPMLCWQPIKNILITIDSTKRQVQIAFWATCVYDDLLKCGKFFLPYT